MIGKGKPLLKKVLTYKKLKNRNNFFFYCHNLFSILLNFLQILVTNIDLQTLQAYIKLIKYKTLVSKIDNEILQSSKDVALRTSIWNIKDIQFMKAFQKKKKHRTGMKERKKKPVFEK